MAYQATLTRGLRFRTPEGVIGSLGEFTGDVMNLAELQAKLAAVDTKEAVDHATIPIVVLVASASVLLATLPVLFIGLAFVLATALSLNQGVSLLIVGAVFAAIAGVVALIAVRRFVTSFESFRRSREELVRNLSWIRTVISQSPKTAHRPGA